MRCCAELECSTTHAALGWQSNIVDELVMLALLADAASTRNRLSAKVFVCGCQTYWYTQQHW
jgi:hypothetical protein